MHFVIFHQSNPTTSPQTDHVVPVSLALPPESPNWADRAHFKTECGPGTTCVRVIWGGFSQIYCIRTSKSEAQQSAFSTSSSANFDAFKMKKKKHCFEVICKHQVPSTSSPHLPATLEFRVWKAACYVTLPHQHRARCKDSLIRQALGHCQMPNFQDKLCYLSRQILAADDWWLNSPTPDTKCGPCANPARVDGNPAPLETVQMAGTRETH